MIEIHDLTKRHGPRAVVDGLSFTVRPGRVTGFLGPNGAGKSTTMRMILGLDAPTSGTALVVGERYRDLRRPLRQVGALLDAGAVHPGRSARAHLAAIAAANRIPPSRIDEVLGLTGLGSTRGRVGAFSLGMKQRLGVAAALLGDPGILMLDEPVNGLDPEGIHWIRTLMRELAAEGRTVLVSSHLMSEMALTADHLVIIGKGRLIADTPTAAFLKNTSRTDILVRASRPQELRSLLMSHGAQVAVEADGALAVTGLEPHIVGDLAAAARIGVHELTVRSASLEEAFMAITGDAVDYRAGSIERTHQS
ncbi:ATP-binding cassette domain-containing protein [Catenulispora yoronensis]